MDETESSVIFCKYGRHEMIQATKTGRCANGSQRDSGWIAHWIPVERLSDWDFTRALCGAAPGRTSSGWTEQLSGREDRACSKCETLRLRSHT